MKKINLVLLSMMMLVLAQCTKSEIKPDPVDVSMKGEVSMGDGSKAVILPGSGEINWESGDFLCFYQPDHGLVPLMINNVTGTGNNHHGKVVGRASVSKIQKDGDTWVILGKEVEKLLLLFFYFFVVFFAEAFFAVAFLTGFSAFSSLGSSKYFTKALLFLCMI